jgi:predicted transglutaminase-like protease
MKKLVVASLAITVLLVFCTFDDFLSLHDIRADYVSRAALSYLRVETPEALPPWTETRLEWASVTVSYALRSVLILSNLVILLLLVSRLQRANGHPALQK